MNNITKMLTAAMGGLLIISSANAATVLHGLGTSTTGTVNTTWATMGANSTLTTLTHTVTGSVLDGVTFDYDITVVGLGLSGGEKLGVDGGGQLGDNGGIFNRSGEGVTITISNVVATPFGGQTVEFSGFHQSDTSGGGTVNINGVATSHALNTISPLASTLTIQGNGSGGGNFRIELAGIQFDTVAVPEPSSTALLGLAGLALILRRRK